MRLGEPAAESPRAVRGAAPVPRGSDADPRADLRCCCGSLLARRVDAGVELKCRRCKRTVVLPLADG